MHRKTSFKTSSNILSDSSEEELESPFVPPGLTEKFKEGLVNEDLRNPSQNPHGQTSE
jgi:hypothetical protein